MDYLFNEKAYPIVTAPEKILEELNRDGTRAVIFRDAANIKNDLRVYDAGIHIPDDKDLARRYWRDETQAQHGRIITGEEAHTHLVSPEDIFREAAQAKVVIDPRALDLLSQRTAQYRELFRNIQQGYKGFAPQDEIHTRLLFAPKGGQGRSPMMHVDDVDLTMHFTALGAPLRISDGIISETAWEAMNRDLTRGMSQEQKMKAEKWLSSLTADYNDEFSSVSLGDVVIMKGGKGKNLQDQNDRENTCVHVSSPYIQISGQAAVIYYAKSPSTSLE